MKTPLSSILWRWSGTIDRGPYALIGIVLFVIKHNIDRFVAIFVFDRPWSLFYYFSPSDAARITALSREEIDFYATLLAIAIPFIYVGTTLTLARLRSIGLPGWLVVVFFVPFVNVVFLLLLCVLPAAHDGEKHPTRSGRSAAFLDRLIPESPFGSAALAILLTLPFFFGGFLLSVSYLGQYGWSLFVGLPFCLGLYSVLIYGYHEPRSLGTCLGVSAIASILLGLSLIALAFEGIFCVAMAVPIMSVLSLFGGLIGYAIQRRPWTMSGAPSALVVVVLSVPALMGAEYQSAPQPLLVAVTTSIEVDAPPEAVWHRVVAFTELPPPEELYFKTGVAYPLRAEIHGHGVGAVRHCVFSTGPFVEPIEVWDEPRLLRFSVTEQPPAMEEFTLFSDVRPPHLDNYLVSEGGQFQLVRLPDGRTRLEGTTWYRNRMWPNAYWQIWSDQIIHRIHERVLAHVKGLAERDVAAALAGDGR